MLYCLCCIPRLYTMIDTLHKRRSYGWTAACWSRFMFKLVFLCFRVFFLTAVVSTDVWMAYWYAGWKQQCVTRLPAIKCVMEVTYIKHTHAKMQPYSPIEAQPVILRRNYFRCLIRWPLPTKRNIQGRKIFTHATYLSSLMLHHGGDIIVLGQLYFAQ